MRERETERENKRDRETHTEGETETQRVRQGQTDRQRECVFTKGVVHTARETPKSIVKRFPQRKVLRK